MLPPCWTPDGDWHLHSLSDSDSMSAKRIPTVHVRPDLRDEHQLVLCHILDLQATNPDVHPGLWSSVSLLSSTLR